jgi:hypothetical protein
MRFRRNTFGKIIFFGKFLYIAEIYFGILFLHNKFISETYFLSLKRFRKAASKLEALKTIFRGFLKPYYVLEIEGGGHSSVA